MKLNTLKPHPKAHGKKKRVGRGNGSGHGTYACRGIKGQSARAGGRRRPGFAGGQTPLYMRMPKLGGFKNINRVEYLAINIADLQDKFKDGETVDRQSLVEKGVIRSTKRPVKLLGMGEINVALIIKLDKISGSAKQKILNAKGQVE